MRGLRKQEDSKFEKFFEIIQSAAKRKGCVFFLIAARAATWKPKACPEKTCLVG